MIVVDAFLEYFVTLVGLQHGLLTWNSKVNPRALSTKSLFAGNRVGYRFFPANFRGNFLRGGLGVKAATVVITQKRDSRK
jgi:hypothetical protein